MTRLQLRRWARAIWGDMERPPSNRLAARNRIRIRVKREDLQLRQHHIKRAFALQAVVVWNVSGLAIVERDRLTSDATGCESENEVEAF